MSELDFQILKSIGVLFAFGSVFVIQRLRPHRPLTGSWRSNGGLWVLGTIALAAVCAGCACTVSKWAADQGLGLLQYVSVPLWVAVPLSVVGLDLVSYGWHRANHELPILWRFHQVHHSDPAFTVSTALRFHPGELVLALPLRLLAIAALGVPVAAVLVFEVVFAFANFWEHGNIALPFRFERRMSLVAITPALHRLHHSRESRWLNTNYGTVFSLWDRWFGSYCENDSGHRIDTGLPQIESPLKAIDLLTLPARGIYRGR